MLYLGLLRITLPRDTDTLFTPPPLRFSLCLFCYSGDAAGLNGWPKTDSQPPVTMPTWQLWLQRQASACSKHTH